MAHGIDTWKHLLISSFLPKHRPLSFSSFGYFIFCLRFVRHRLPANEFNGQRKQRAKRIDKRRAGERESMSRRPLRWLFTANSTETLVIIPFNSPCVNANATFSKETWPDYNIATRKRGIKGSEADKNLLSAFIGNENWTFMHVQQQQWVSMSTFLFRAS